MLAQLFLAGLVTVVTETLETGGATIEVERYHITDKGREAIEE
jgi:DNA-binding PadR family transcriptional regulator